MLVDKEKGWGSYKIEAVTKKKDVIRLENDEVVTSNIVFGMVHGRPSKTFQKIPPIPVSITRH
jgi:hypothetical protein